jgi:nucleotide-binding universal stress UspA family protein
MMEHIVVAIRPGQGPGVVAWALRHARAGDGALEIIASGMEWPYPHGALLGVGLQLIADGCDVPFAMRTVAVGMPLALALAHAKKGVDLIVLGSRTDRLDRTEAASLVAIASASACPVVIVPAGWRVEAEDGSVLVTEALAASGHTEALVEKICAGTAPIRIVPTSFARAERQPVTS